MVLIISIEDDFSTNSVISWLNYYNIKYFRISVEDKLEFQNVFINNNEFDISFTINESFFKLSDFKAFWYRRGHFNIFLNQINEKNKFIKEINDHLRTETYELKKLFLSYISARSINKYEDIKINKLEALKLASSCGIEIPETIVTNSKKEVKFFFEKHNKLLITKNFSQGIFIKYKGKSFGSLVQLVSQEMIDNLEEKFDYSLFQVCVDKFIELRVFFINNVFYSSAIFSQEDDQTKIDFRNYNYDNPNRTPPFELPVVIKNNLTLLMNKLKLNSGSIDIIVSKEFKYYFLEVNPVGQFSQVSFPCNYFIEEKVALELIKIKNNEYREV